MLALPYLFSTCTKTRKSVTGAGSLYAYGGDAGDGGAHNRDLGGNAGSGGGGGAGAGIGGNGGVGGEGGIYGADGAVGENAGSIIVYAKVYAYGGSGGSSGNMAADVNTYDGSGAGGYPAAGIGGGGAGAGSGSGALGGGGFTGGSSAGYTVPENSDSTPNVAGTVNGQGGNVGGTYGGAVAGGGYFGQGANFDNDTRYDTYAPGYIGGYSGRLQTVSSGGLWPSVSGSAAGEGGSVTRSKQDFILRQGIFIKL